MLVVDYIVNRLEKEGITTIFGYQGGNIACLIDAIGRSNIRFVETRHEQGAAFAANAAAQVANMVGVAVSSSGPGASNLITGILNAYLDSIPCLFITGNVNSSNLLRDKKYRQNSFQEADISSMVLGITKYSKTITNPDNIAQELEDALYAAKEGRPGPALIDIPHDIQNTQMCEISVSVLVRPFQSEQESMDISEAYNLLKDAKRPLILIGGGARSSQSKKLLNKVLKEFKIPVVATLCGLDCISHINPCYSGMIGDYGNIYANLALYHCDVLLVLGARLADRQLLLKDLPLDQITKIIHVDIDRDEIDRTSLKKTNYIGKVETFLSLLLEKKSIITSYDKWFEKISLWKKNYPSFENDYCDLKVNNFIKEFSKYIKPKSIVCADVGLHQMSVAQSLEIQGGCHILNSAALGAMGYAIPAAIGACLAANGVVTYCFVGDGGLQMNLQELQVLSENALPICIVVINNSCLGMIREYQKYKFDARFIGSKTGYSVPDIEKIALAFCISYLRVKNLKEIYQLDEWLFNEPLIIEVCVPEDTGTMPTIYENNTIVRKSLGGMNVK